MMVTVFWLGWNNYFVSGFLNSTLVTNMNKTLTFVVTLFYKLHCAVPKVSSEGELILKTKRLMDHALIPELLIFLLEHSRKCDFLFHKLKRKIIGSTFVSKIVQSKSLLDFEASDWSIFQTVIYRLYNIAYIK